MPEAVKSLARNHPLAWKSGIAYHVLTAIVLIWVWWEINRKRPRF